MVYMVLTEGPETQTEWKSESVTTDQPTNRGAYERCFFSFNISSIHDTLGILVVAVLQEKICERCTFALTAAVSSVVK